MLRPATSYGRLSRTELIDELLEVMNTLTARIKELGAMQQDYNNDYYPAYMQSPGHSVSAKEKEAEYACLQLVNDLALTKADIEFLTELRELLYFVIPYASE